MVRCFWPKIGHGAPMRSVSHSPGLQHGVLEVLAQKVRVATGDGTAGLESVLLDSLRHLHEKLGHLYRYVPVQGTLAVYKI